MIRSAELFTINIPMLRPFSHARKTRVDADNVIFVLDLDGHSGIGESIPRDYVTGETVDSVFDAILQLDIQKCFAGLPTNDFGEAVRFVEQLALPSRLVQAGNAGLAAACAVEMAVLDALGKKFSSSVGQIPHLLNPSVFSSTPLQPTCGTLTFSFDQPPDSDVLPAFVRHVKVKVGRDIEEDYKFLRVVRRCLGHGNLFV
jgi:hypothetical protein